MSATARDIRSGRAAVLAKAEQIVKGPDSRAETLEEDAYSAIVPTPQLDERALYGVLGELVRLIEPHTEAHPAGILFSSMAMLGALIGRSPYLDIDGNRHGANLFVLLVGPTSSGRKGTAAGWARRILRRVDEDFDKRNVAGGLSTGEGLIHRVRDAGLALPGEKHPDPGVTDKRLVVTAEEMGAAFRKAQGRESSLFHTLRMAWDGGTLSTLTRRESMTATDPHISVLGQITPAELRACVTDADAAGGTLNRFLYAFVERVRSLPEGGAPDEARFDELTTELRRRVVDARSVSLMRFDPEARATWSALYEHLQRGFPGRIGQVTTRAAPLVRRLAMLYALLNGHRTITFADLEAAEALWCYALDSARFVFGARALTEIEQRILDALAPAGARGLSRTDLSMAVFRSGSTARTKLEAALVTLREADLVRMYQGKADRGRPPEMWRLSEHALRARQGF